MFKIDRSSFSSWARIVCASLSVFCAANARADWQPDNAVQVYVGVGAGGALDQTARLAQAIWQTKNLIAKPVMVENKPGAGGAIALNELATRPGNAQVIGFVSPTLVSNKLMGSAKLDAADFTPLALLSNDYIVFVVRADSPIRTGKQLIDGLRDPKFNIGNATQLGNSNHIALAGVAKASGIDVRKLAVVIYKSGGESTVALMGGQVDMIVTAASNVMAQVKAGKLRVVAVAAPKRMGGLLADVPTWREQGVDVVYGVWRGVVGPKGMTPDQIAYWDKVFAQTVASPQWKETLAQTYSEDAYLPSAAFAKFLNDDKAQQARALKDLGLAD